MYKFWVNALLRNGKEVCGMYETEHRTGSEAVIDMIGSNLNENKLRFTSLMSEDGNEQIVFRAEDISALKISAYQPKEV
jgi:hypothetical protein